jgi:DNA-binding transcriptional regulator YbjK
LTRPVQERARRRRAALVSAAVELLEEGGFAAVTHRAVAQRAGLPLAATTYYFTSRADLVAEAFAELATGELGAMRKALAGAAAGDLVPALLAAGGVGGAPGDRLRNLGLWELYVQAGRDPALRRIARGWTDGCVEVIAEALMAAGHRDEPDAARRIALLVTGLWLEHLVEDRPVAEAEELLRAALTVGAAGCPGEHDGALATGQAPA